MNYPHLPPVKKIKPLDISHFPSPFHCAVFRLWETVRAEKIATALDTTVDVVKSTAESMGLPEQCFNEKWETLGYITTIRNMWHLLPYDQLLTLLGLSEKRLSVILKEDDFLSHKLGYFKPECERVTPPEHLSESELLRLAEIKSTVKGCFSTLFDGKQPFDFFENNNVPHFTASNVASEDIRMVFSYCGLYASVLENDISLSYPESLLEKYRSMGINAIWLHSALYQLVPFPFDESYSKGYEERRKRLCELISLADKYGIKVYIYINEPRCMPLAFFKKHPELLGRVDNGMGALCTSHPEVMKYLRYAVRELCRAIPGLGGFFAITASENLTHCKSRDEGTECERCRLVPISTLISEVLTAISEESRAVNPKIKTIAWTWAWDYFMNRDEIRECIASIPKEIIIQTNSEASKSFKIGGVHGTVQDYSMSIPGPSEVAKGIWSLGSEYGHDLSAKVQVSCTWECSTVPYLPVFDLIREHMTNLSETGVQHLMLSWTVGGYPSVNLKIASECMKDSSEERYLELLKDEYGEYAQTVREAARIFSDAFREFPFHIQSLYKGPQNAGPSNLLYRTPTGLSATMTCYSYDDLDSWRAIYPRDVYINQLKKLSDKWKEGLELLSDMPECEFKDVSLGGYLLFYSSYLQARFCDERKSDIGYALCKIVTEEKKNALQMYGLMQKSSLFGYEAANHYYFNRGMLAEKVILCEYLEKYYKSRYKGGQ